MRSLRSLIILTFISSTALATAPVSLIEVFTKDSGFKQSSIQNRSGREIELVVYNLSAPDEFNKHLSKGLAPGGDLEDAKQHIMKKMEALPDTYMNEHVMLPYQGVLKAMEYKLIKLPAIVFNNGESMIYGVKDVNQALTIRAKKFR